MLITIPVQAVFALAIPSAGDSRTETLTIFFPTLTFLASAGLGSIRSVSRDLHFEGFFCFSDCFGVALAVGAAQTAAFRATHFSRGKAFAVHFETLSFFACATSFFLS